MWRRIRWFIVLIILCVAGGALQKPAEKYFDIAKSLDIFATLFKEVNAYYVDEVDPEKLIGHGIEGMLQSLDPYTDYIPEEEIESFQISTTGQYGGIGAVIGIIKEKTVVTHPYRNFPAFKSGMRVGDEIVSVDGNSVEGKSPVEISTMLKGPARTKVEIKVKRAGRKETETLEILREKISVSNLSYFGMAEPGIGYMRLDDFTPGAANEVAAAMKKLKAEGAYKLILDVRNNPGGLLHEAVNIVGLFVDKGLPVVSTKGKVDEWNKTYKTLSAPVDRQMELVILVGEGSASASEIVAGALQDYDRAVLVGQRTFGKGLVQTTRRLAYNAQLKVTTAKYFIPSGRCIQALDYAHRKTDGSAERFADSAKIEFKTRAGRKVFDGGGLDPDFKVEEQYAGAITSSLVNSGLVFQYASMYHANHPEKPDLSSFSITDKDFNDFLQFIRDEKFSYTTPLEDDIKKLLETAKKERYYEHVGEELDELNKRVEAGKATDLKNYKAEIMEILSEQIAFHYDLYEGQAQLFLKYDNAILEARKLLRDSVAYRKLLSIN